MKHRLAALYQSMSRRPDLTAFILITIVTVCYFWPVLFGGRVILGFDTVTHFYSSHNLLRNSIFSGEFPLWTPYPAGGTFIVAGPAHAVYYPLTYLNLIFPPTHANGIFVVIHIIIFTFFMYRLARECKASFLGGLVTAMTAHFCGTMLATIDFSDFLAGLAWYSIVLVCFVRLIKNTNKINAAFFAMACAMQVLTGSPYPPYYALVTIVLAIIGYAIVCRPSARSFAILMAHAVVAGMVALLLTAPLLVPMVDVMRGVSEFGHDALFPKHYAMRLADWVPVVIKSALGYDDTTKSYYLGLLPLLIVPLGLYVLVLQKLKKSTPAGAGNGRGKIIAVLVLLAIASFFVSFGGYISFAGVSIDKILFNVPVLGRCVAHWFSFMGIPAAASMFILAGLSFDLLMEARHDARIRRLACLPPLAGVVAGIAILIFRSEAVAALDLFRATYWRWSHSPYFMPEVMNLRNFPSPDVVTHFAILLAVCSGLLALPFVTRLKTAVIFALFAACILVDKNFFFHTRRVSNFSPVNIYTQVPDTVKFFRERNPGNPLYRVYVDPLLREATLMVAEPKNPEDYMFIRSNLIGGASADFGVYSSMNLLTFNEGGWRYLLDPWMASLRGDIKQRMLELWNVKYVLGYAVDEQRRLKITLQEYPNPAPRAWLSYSKYPVASLRDSLGLTQSLTFNPRDTVLVVEPGARIGVSQLTGTPGTRDVDSIHYTNNTVTIKATAERDAWLYISDTYERGWRAYINGKRTPVFRANLNGRVVAFPAGTHTVLFRYSPPSIWTGLWIGAAAWLAMAVYLFTQFRARRVSAGSD